MRHVLRLGALAFYSSRVSAAGRQPTSVHNPRSSPMLAFVTPASMLTPTLALRTLVLPDQFDALCATEDLLDSQLHVEPAAIAQRALRDMEST